MLHYIVKVFHYSKLVIKREFLTLEQAEDYAKQFGKQYHVVISQYFR